ncbi:uncharacterized protein B0H18DRAFT_965290 [Fomitopsis serialis]|uniref:uncharacterized protein n=1 Tax=Fomitopsis serialis TaxID=139415 RepID=UPI0020077B80|nr:uncharacterized protein B0H18DRAFT_965290 [Neoantrodia serialis]KAH9938055.1 hypothetical protein B0H18DRAFT_965290 [Neoantrodia serialis]
MVFGLFSKKLPPPPPASIPLPPSPSPSKAELLPPEPTKQAQTQLRTPSPSVDSASIAHGPAQSPSPAAQMARLSVDERIRQGSPTRQAGPSTLVQTLGQPAFVPPEATVDSLAAHIKSIPAKILHAYVLSHLPHAPELLLPALATFFAELAPPEKLHCVRCHKDYVEVENDDRSCLVAHDDESAEVERVGRGAKTGRPLGDPGTTYETIWGCCGKITEGDGDQGPPDGWCYEGKHTTDIKRARFRADSTPTNDKLVSCLRRNCHGIRDQLPRASLRKRRREVNLKEASTEEDDMSEGDADSGVDEIMGRRIDRKGKGKAKEKPKNANDENEQMDVDDNASRAGSVRGRGRGRPPKSAANTPSGPGAPKRRGRPPKSKVQEATDVEGADADVDDTMSVRSSVAPAEAPKRRGRKPKSKAYIEDSDAEMRVEDSEMERARNRERKEKGPRTRSQSRTRGAEGKSKTKARKTRDENVNEAKATGDEEDELPKKKRKTAA